MGEDLVGISSEDPQQVVLGRGEMNLGAAPRDHVPREVDGHLTDAKDRVLWCAGAAEHGA